MNGFHRPNPTDSHAELSTGSMAEMRALIDRQAESISQLAQERDAFRNALLDVGVPPDMLDPAVLDGYSGSLKGVAARAGELERELAVCNSALSFVFNQWRHLQPWPVYRTVDDLKAHFSLGIAEHSEGGRA